MKEKVTREIVGEDTEGRERAGRGNKDIVK